MQRKTNVKQHRFRALQQFLFFPKVCWWIDGMLMASLEWSIPVLSLSWFSPSFYINTFSRKFQRKRPREKAFLRARTLKMPLVYPQHVVDKLTRHTIIDWKSFSLKILKALLSCLQVLLLEKSDSCFFIYDLFFFLIIVNIYYVLPLRQALFWVFCTVYAHVVISMTWGLFSAFAGGDWGVERLNSLEVGEGCWLATSLVEDGALAI